MPKDIIFFDLETQKSASEVGGWGNPAAMGISLAVTYSTAREKYEIFSEKRLDQLVDTLLKADLVVGFNTIGFDYEVLMAATILDLHSQLRSLDILVELKKELGHRLALDSVAIATLGLGKIASGTDALKWYREGKMKEIAEYCCFDVKVTKLVYEYAIEHGKLFYLDRSGHRQSVSTPWKWGELA
ncbi:MAG: ribonuclease H-like domain-containing protein [Chthoniobacterales bacterium]